jgi:hypothetical protein
MTRIFDVLIRLRLSVLIGAVVLWNVALGGAYLIGGQRWYAIAGPVACLLVSFLALWLASSVTRMRLVYREDCDADGLTRIRGQLWFVAFVTLTVALAPLLWR